ncbi:TlyA family RNA methyltransferase [Patescibacteria group bacterium]|nr:TlyA family RNA methyltransferase [Patescibacteria group bacterium]
MKVRLDDLLVTKGISTSKSKAQTLIKSGGVQIAEITVIKPGRLINSGTEIQVSKNKISKSQKYVGRGALKLEAAIKEFKIPIKDKIAVDLGACTGGFTDYLLQKGAKKVFAIDVGHDQLAQKLKNDPRVINLEGVNIRNPLPSKVPKNVDLAVADLSHISLKLVLKNIFALVRSGGDIILLIKPQFEAGPGIVNKQGIIKEDEIREKIVADFIKWCTDNNYQHKKLIKSPIQGKTGNIEYLAWFKSTDSQQE